MGQGTWDIAPAPMSPNVPKCPLRRRDRGHGTSSLRRASNVQNGTEGFRDLKNWAGFLSIGIRQSDFDELPSGLSLRVGDNRIAIGTGGLGLAWFGAIWRGLVWRDWRELAASQLQCDLGAVG